MSFSSDDIYVLQIIARTGSFSEAAKELHRVPSAVSYVVKKMEKELDVRLFNRCNKQVQPTAAAKYIIEHGDWILQGIRELKRNVIELDTGIDRTFTIALNYIIRPEPVSKLIEQLAIAFPATEFSIRTEVYNGCWDALYEGRADFVIGAPQNAPLIDNVSTEYIGDINWTFVVSANHPLAQSREVLHAETLRSYPSIVVHDSSVALQPKKTWALKGQRMIYAADLNMVLEMIAAGIGIGFLPQSFVHSALAQGRVVSKTIAEHKQPVPVYYAWKLQKKRVILEYLLTLLSDSSYKQLWLQ